MFNIEDLKKMSVFELRNKAREIGVHAPTTKTSAQMIADILAIQRGEMQPKKSKMGRPPKAIVINNNKLNQKLSETSLAKNGFETPKFAVGGVLEACGEPQALNEILSDCYGVIRTLDDKYYINNYFDTKEYVLIADSVTNDLSCGDVVVGKYKRRENTFGLIAEYSKLDVGGNNNQSKKEKICIKGYKNNKELYEYIDGVNGNNIVVEVERSLKLLPMGLEKGLGLYTNECEDIINSYNMLLDVKNLVTKLCAKNKSFTLFFVNVTYLYSILSLYYEFKGHTPDVNAGQFFKEILSIVKNSKFGSIVLCEKQDSIRRPYLDLIINKYSEIE